MHKPTRLEERPPFDRIALVLQGGGALGAYRPAFTRRWPKRIHPDWVAGVSIGAINSAIIAGNEPAERVDQAARLLAGDHHRPCSGVPHPLHSRSRASCAPLFNQFVRHLHACRRRPGFLHACAAAALPAPGRQPRSARAIYDTAPLKARSSGLSTSTGSTPARMRFSVGAVNVRTGNFVYFDNDTHTIRPEHVMASGSLAARLSGGRDRGRISTGTAASSRTRRCNGWSSGPRQDTLAFQVDLWSARGEFRAIWPRSNCARRKSSIRAARAPTPISSSSTSAAHRAREPLSKLPPDLLARRGSEHAGPKADQKVYNLVHLIYRSKQYEGTRRTTSFRGCPWRSIGAPATTTPCARCAIPRHCSGPTIWKGCAPSILPSTDGRGDRAERKPSITAPIDEGFSHA